MCMLGIARKPGMSRDGTGPLPYLRTQGIIVSKSKDLFATNAAIIRSLTAAIALHCPAAFILIVTIPVNSTLPVAVSTLQAQGAFQPTKVFGVTTLDVVRTSTFVAHAIGDADPGRFKIPVVGGHSGKTILPLLSRCVPKVDLSDEVREKVILRKGAVPEEK